MLSNPLWWVMLILAQAGIVSLFFWGYRYRNKPYPYDLRWDKTLTRVVITELWFILFSVYCPASAPSASTPCIIIGAFFPIMLGSFIWLLDIGESDPGGGGGDHRDDKTPPPDPIPELTDADIEHLLNTHPDEELVRLFV